MSRRAVLLSLVLSLSAAASWAADRPTARLAYVRMPGAEQCPGPVEAKSAVVTRLGYDPFREDAGDSIEVFIEPNGAASQLRARLQLKRGGEVRGKRELSSVTGDCAELSNALTLAIAIAVDPQAFLAGPAPVPPPAPAPAAPPPPPAAELVLSPPPPPPPLEPQTKVHLTAGLGVLGLLGTTPGVITGGLSVRVGVRGERWSVNLDGRVELPRSLELAPGTASVTNLAALLAPCFHAGVFAACGLVGAGVTRVSSEGLPDSGDASAPFVQAGARAQVLVPLSRRFSLGGSIDLLAPLARPVLLVGRERVWAAPPVNASLGVFGTFGFL